MNASGLDFEKPILELERKIEELKGLTETEKIDLSSEIEHLNARLKKLTREIFENLNAWQRVQIARHPQRPYSLDYINLIMRDFLELHGDRLFADDKAIVCGVAKIDGQKVMVIGHQKGRDTKSNIYRNFGMANPEGYRKALRVMKLGAKYKKPIVILKIPIGISERHQEDIITEPMPEGVKFCDGDKCEIPIRRGHHL